MQRRPEWIAAPKSNSMGPHTFSKDLKCGGYTGFVRILQLGAHPREPQDHMSTLAKDHQHKDRTPSGSTAQDKGIPEQWLCGPLQWLCGPLQLTVLSGLLGPRGVETALTALYPQRFQVQRMGP